MTDKVKKFGFIKIALMYVGTIMGAGFASGREIWQFFGVFGKEGIVGVIIVGIFFIIVGYMTAAIAREKKTGEMGEIIVPFSGIPGKKFVSYFMAFMLYTVLITMSAAAGALFNQQLGINPKIGGGILTALVIITVIGGIGRISEVFRDIMPALIFIVIFVAIMTITGNVADSNLSADLKPSPLTPNWAIAPVLYLSYNVLAAIPVVGTAAYHSKDKFNGILGACLGGFGVGMLALIIAVALTHDSGFSQAVDLPMLGYAGRIDHVAGIIYSAVLFVAMYSSATSNFYGFTTEIRNEKHKKIKVTIFAISAYVLGFVGFKNVVAYMFPIEGYLGCIIIIMLVVNFVKTIILKKSKGDYHFPEGIHSVTGGVGGDATLISKYEKTAVVDCGMAFFANNLIDNIEMVLGDRPLDYLFLTHTHYDHLGATAALRERWPELKVYGSEYGQYLLEKESCINAIAKMTNHAAEEYNINFKDYDFAKLKISDVLKDKDRVDLGGAYIEAVETKGHTDCSLAFYLNPDEILFSSESTGVYLGKNFIIPSILKSYKDSMKAVDNCRKYKVKNIIIPHYGLLPKALINTYWDLYVKEAAKERTDIISMKEKGFSMEMVCEKITEKEWKGIRRKEQPYEAFSVNLKHTVNMYYSEDENV